jgi:EAL domain-containing protein (putative c-di-GMP-specific phosphodiesterase class I)/GGDEF domain-containing protein
MSLLRQLLLSVSVAIAVILLGTFALSMSTARDYLGEQLKTQSEDGATALALSLSQPDNSDPTSQESLITALYDSGHFAVVRYSDMDGKVLFERQNPAARTSTPYWFQSVLPLTAASATRPVREDRKTIGEVTLVAADAYAWDTLWRSSMQMIALILGAGAVWAMFAAALMYWLENRLLREASQHVRAIGQGEFHENIRPRVSELAGLADAVNQTRDRVRASSLEQTSRIESLLLELNLDPITKLANRKFFINALRQHLEKDPEPTAAQPLGDRRMQAGGHVLVFRQRDLALINRHMQRDLVDQWLHSVADRVTRLLHTLDASRMTLARLNGSDFAVLMPSSQASEAAFVAERIRLELRSSRLPVGEGMLCRWALALADYRFGTKASDVLAQLDHALMRSESAGEDAIALPLDSSPSAAGTGEYAWKDAIVTALEQHRFSLSTNALTTPDGMLLRHEATLTLHSDTSLEPVPADLFIPPAIRLGLSAECDIQAVRLGLDWLVSNSGDLATRIALHSLAQANFLSRLEKMIGDRPEPARRLLIEIDAHGVTEHRRYVDDLCRIAQRNGVRVGLRRLAEQFGALTHLHELTLTYVKLSGAFVAGLAASPGSRQLAASVVNTAQALDIDVYAEDVPDDETRRILRNLGCAIMCRPTTGCPHEPR